MSQANVYPEYMNKPTLTHNLSITCAEADFSTSVHVDFRLSKSCKHTRIIVPENTHKKPHFLYIIVLYIQVKKGQKLGQIGYLDTDATVS